MVTPENIDEDLREACAMGDEGKVHSLINSGAKVNSANKMNGWTALHWASYRGHRNIVMILLNKGADPSAENTKGETVLDLLSGHTLELLAGTEVEDAAQYPLPVEELPIVPNYIKNPEFPYSKKDSAPSVLPSSLTANPKEKAEGEAKLNEFFKGLSDKMKKEKESEVVAPPEGGSEASPPKPTQGVVVELRQNPNMPIRITQAPPTRPVHMNPQPIPNPMIHHQVPPNPQQIVPNPQFQRQFVPYRHTAYQGQTYGVQNTQPRFINNVQIAHIEPYHPNNPIPVQHRTYNTPNNPNMYNTRPPHYQMGPVQQHPGMQNHMLSRLPMPSVTPITPQTPPPVESPGFTTPTKPMSPTSPNSTQSTPPAADATLKVRLSGTTDFFEVDLCEIGESYTSLVKCFADELELDEEKVCKVRKLPNILIRKDRDVKRIKAGAEFEVELTDGEGVGS